MTEKIPVEAGQWRRYAYTIYAVYRPAKRKGWWVLVSSEFPYPIFEEGRRAVEKMELVENADYFGKGNPHPGVDYHEAIEKTRRG